MWYGSVAFSIGSLSDDRFLRLSYWTTDRNGERGPLLRGPVSTIVWSSVTAALGVVALAFGAGGWLKQRASLLERTIAIVSGLLLIYPSAGTDAVGLALLIASVGLHFLRVGKPAVIRS